MVKTSDIYVRYESLYFLNRGEEMNEIAEFDRSKRSGNDALCCAMHRGYLKLHNAGREVEALSTDDSVTINMISWPFYIWIEARKDYVLVDEDAHHFRQNFTLLIKTVNDSGKMALENVPFTDCSSCNKRLAGKLCIFHAIPPWEFVRCFCLAHPDLRDRNCNDHHDPGTSECPMSCPHWELIKGEMITASPAREHSLTAEKCVLKASGDVSAYSCIAEMVFHRLGNS
jgi:hypothetical protein